MKPFGPDSDLDLAIVSEVHFETAWRDLRKAAQPTALRVDQSLTENLDHQRKRFFDGAILANHLLPALSFGPQWTGAMVRVEEKIALALGGDRCEHVDIPRLLEPPQLCRDRAVQMPNQGRRQMNETVVEFDPQLAATASNYTVNQFKKWADEKALVLRPPFQRNLVWNDRQKSYLINSILRGLPIPEIMPSS